MDLGHDFHELPVGRLHGPTDLKLVPDADDGGNGMNDIAESGETDHQKALHRMRIFSRIAVVE